MKKNKGLILKPFSIDRVLNKELFMEKLYRKYAPKAILILIFSLSTFLTENSHCMQEILLKRRYFAKILSKSLKKVNFTFYFEPGHF